MAVTECVLRSVHAREALAGVEAIAIYNVTVDKKTVGPAVILGARDPDLTDPIPLVGQTFAETVDGVSHPFPNLVADTIDAAPVQDTGGQLSWLVTVNYRSPTLSPSLRNPVDINKKPEDRKAEVWTEYVVLTEERRLGRPLVDIKWPWKQREAGVAEINASPATRKAGQLGPITNAAGLRYGPVQTLQRRLPVFVYKKNISNPYSFIRLQRVYENTLNDDTWDVWGLGFVNATRRRCMFWYAATGTPMYWNSKLYYELEVRVIYDQNFHLVKQRNEGEVVWESRTDPNDARKKQWKFTTPHAAGMPIPPPIPLDRDGELLKTDSKAKRQDVIFFEDLEAKDFDDMMTRLKNLR